MRVFLRNSQSKVFADELLIRIEMECNQVLIKNAREIVRTLN